MKKKKEEKKEEIEITTPERGFDVIFGNNQAQAETTPEHDKILIKALDELFSVEGIDLKSDIDNRQIPALTRGYIFAEVYKCRYMAELVKHVLELSVSKNRLGRGEFVKVLQSSSPSPEEQPLRLMRRRLLE